MRIQNRAAASVDHIFTKSFFKDREDSTRRKDYNRDWNCQPMHQECNRKRGGQIHGFPLFACSCHWLQIDGTLKGHTLALHYRTSNGKVELITVNTEKHAFVFNNRSTGKYSALFGGSSEVGIGGVWLMGQLKPGKRGITGKGQLGHALPRIAPQEVQIFNRLEVQRVQGIPRRRMRSSITEWIRCPYKCILRWLRVLLTSIHLRSRRRRRRWTEEVICFR